MAKRKLMVILSLICVMGTVTPSIPTYAGEEATVAETIDLSEEVTNIPLHKIEVDENDPDYAALYETEVYNYKVIRNLENAYEQEAWSTYCNAANALLTMDIATLDDNGKATIMNVYNLRKELKQIKNAEDCMWYIWGEDMPIAEEESTLEFTVASYDNADFRPYLVPYMLEDQAQVKGNIILVSGGGFESRANDAEGFPAAHKFNELGYNCFLLQRRVAPYGTTDIYADLQRALRYLRYNQKSLGLGAIDKWIAAGWSGGAATVLGAVALNYGDIQPTVIDADYVPDEIDTVNSDFDVVIPVYGASYDFSQDFNGLETENPNLPAFFISMGADDATVNPDDAMKLFNSVKDKTEAELHIFSQNSHGYGVGKHNTNSEVWPELADQFIQQSVILRNDDTVEVCSDIPYGEIPEKYTKMQKLTCYAGFGTADVTVAVNEEENAYFMFFEAFGQQSVLAGLVDEGYVNNLYDRTGAFATAAQYIYNSVDENAWEPVQ